METSISKLKGIYNHLMAIRDSKQLDQDKIKAEMRSIIGELTRESLEEEDYRDKWLIHTNFGFIKLDTMLHRVQYQSNTYTKEYFHTMEEIREIAPKYEIFARKVDNEVLAGMRLGLSYARV